MGVSHPEPPRYTSHMILVLNFTGEKLRRNKVWKEGGGNEYTTADQVRLRRYHVSHLIRAWIQRFDLNGVKHFPTCIACRRQFFSLMQDLRDWYCWSCMAFFLLRSHGRELMSFSRITMKYRWHAS
jgi:hypothetical protein